MKSHPFWGLLFVGICPFFLLTGQTPAIGQNPGNTPKNPPKSAPLVEERVPWVGSRIIGSPEPPPPFQLERAFSRLSFRNPLHMTLPPQGPNAVGENRFFVCEQGGKIFSFVNQDGVTQKELVVDLPRDLTRFDKEKSSGVGDLYALVFHPEFAKNRYCYVCYVLNSKTPQPLPDGSRVSRFRMLDTNPPRIDPTSEKVMITWLGGGHNGCDLHFGPDGFLYISTGDAASPNPPDSLNTGQDISDLLSSILRIDVDREEKGNPYTIPPDNPFLTTPKARPEVWAYGFRNPWRMSFDRKTGDLWVGDVGWEQWEMIYRVKKAGNYGWPIMEGPQPVRPESPRGPTPILPPAISLPHTESASITGGFVYRGKAYPELDGTYIYGDWVSGKVWGTRFDGDKILNHRELALSNERIVTFAEDQNKELFLLNHSENGFIFRLVPNQKAKVAAVPFPQTLSQTSLFSSVPKHDLAPGVLPFSINSPMWADGASSIRFVALPDNSSAKMYERAPPWPSASGEVQFPLNGVLGKTISMEMEPGNPQSRRNLETQILHWDGINWKGYTYAWNEEQTDATLVPARGMDKKLLIGSPSQPEKRNSQTWHFPSRTECLTCHNSWAGYTLAFQPGQLNKSHDFGGMVKDQLATLEKAGVVQFLELASNNGSDKPRAIPADRLADPLDARQALGDRARSYLHVNCSHCHQFGAGGTALIDLRVKNKIEQTNLVGERPLQGAFEMAGAKLVAPGDPYHSVLYYRMAKMGPGRMPHIGSDLVDPQGIKLIHDWIVSLPPGKEPSKPVLTIPKDFAFGEIPSERTVRIKEALATPSGALALMTAMDSGKIPEPVKKEIIAAVESVPQMGIRDLFERYLPADQRVKRLGSMIRPEPILAQKGDPLKGKALFFQTSGLQCANCHRVAGKGSNLGPDLSEIGKKYTKVQILESLLEPSKVIDPKYGAHLVETQNGKIFTGILVSKTDKEIVLKMASDQEARIPANQVASFVPQQKSLMPEQLLRDLTLEQAADLLEFLAQCK